MNLFKRKKKSHSWSSQNLDHKLHLQNHKLKSKVKNEFEVRRPNYLWKNANRRESKLNVIRQLCPIIIIAQDQS